MSLTDNGQYLECDGRQCTARARVPIGLRQILAGNTPGINHTVAGWLFVFRDGEYRHYCTTCSSKYLGDLQDREGTAVEPLNKGRERTNS